MNKEYPKSEPSEPVVVWSERDLKLREKVVIVLFGERGDDE